MFVAFLIFFSPLFFINGTCLAGECSAELVIVSITAFPLLGGEVVLKVLVIKVDLLDRIPDRNTSVGPARWMRGKKRHYNNNKKTRTL